MKTDSIRLFASDRPWVNPGAGRGSDRQIPGSGKNDGLPAGVIYGGNTIEWVQSTSVKIKVRGQWHLAEKVQGFSKTGGTLPSQRIQFQFGHTVYTYTPGQGFTQG